MKKNRLIALVLIIASGVFAGFFGGSFSYAVFYAAVCVPAASLGYMLYVFFRLKIYQRLEVKTMVKGEKTSYKYILSNEDFIFYKSVRVEFMSDYSKVDADEAAAEISLTPGEKVERETSVTCLYRGEYHVGINSVIIKDCLNLFEIRMNKPSVITAVVHPRILRLSSLAALKFHEDVKISPFSLSFKNEMPDNDLKNYSEGDNPKSINWKASARHNELFVRRYTEIPKERVALILDMSPIPDGIGDKIILEDAILETAIAIADYYMREKIESAVFYYSDSERSFSIKDGNDFSLFYRECATIRFNAGLSVGEYMCETLSRFSGFNMIIVISARVDPKTLEALKMISCPRSCAALAGDRGSEELEKTRILLGKTKLIVLPENQDINKILEKGIG